MLKKPKARKNRKSPRPSTKLQVNSNTVPKGSGIMKKTRWVVIVAILSAAMINTVKYILEPEMNIAVTAQAQARVMAPGAR